MSLALLRPRLAALAGMAVLAGACGGSAPRRVDGPVTMPTPAVTAFRYTPGRYVYELRNETVIQAAGDTVRQRDSVSTVTVVGYTVSARPDGLLAIAGSIDSFVVRSVSRPAQSPPLSRPVAFTAQMDSTGELRAFAAVDSVDCISPAGALLATARDLLVAVPLARLTPGARWQDTTTSTVCRGELPVTTTAVQQYQVLGAGNEPATIRVRRTADIRMSGEGTPRGQTIAITGKGRATAELLFDLARGRFVSSTGSYDAQLKFDGGGITREFVQQVKQQVTLR